MFDIGWIELMVIAIVAIVVVGPKDLPRAMRFVGQWSAKMKKMAREFQGQFNEALREAELDGVKKDIESITKIDPMAGVRKEMAKVDSAVRDATRPAAKAAAPAASAPVSPPVETEAPEPMLPVEPAAPVAEAKP